MCRSCESGGGRSGSGVMVRAERMGKGVMGHEMVIVRELGVTHSVEGGEDGEVWGEKVGDQLWSYGWSWCGGGFLGMVGRRMPLRKC